MSWYFVIDSNCNIVRYSGAKEASIRICLDTKTTGIIYYLTHLAQKRDHILDSQCEC